MRQRLVIRADADTRRGTGHVMRMIALAQQWKLLGGDVLFVSRMDGDRLKARILAEGFALAEPEGVHPDPADLRGLLDLTTPEDRIALDGYHFDPAYMEALHEAGRFTLVMDDCFNRPRFVASVLVNQNPCIRPGDYSVNPDALVLCGTKYALLRREMLDRPLPETREPGPLRVLVTYGGSDPDNHAARTLTELVGLVDKAGAADLLVRVVVGPMNPWRGELETLAADLPYGCELLDRVEDMAELMDWADLAFSAAGSTCWELCCRGVPMVVSVVADNQRGIAENLVRAGAAVELADSDAVVALLADPGVRKEMARIGRTLVDGQGSRRLASLKRVLFLGYDEQETKLIEALCEKGCVVEHSRDKVEDFRKYDLVISYGYRHIIPKRLIDQGVPIVNLHTAWLPYNRGAHPNFWAFHDDTPKGVTIHLIDEGVDTGPLIARREVAFDEGETTFVDTYLRLRREIEDLFLSRIDEIVEGTYETTPQTGEGTFHKLADLPEIIGGWSAEIRQTLKALQDRPADADDKNVLSACRRCLAREHYLERPDCETRSVMGRRMGCAASDGLGMRPAVEQDWEVLLRWRNDENSRNFSFNTELIDPESHMAWLKGKLNDPNTLFLVAEIDGRPAGQVRFDLVDGEVVVSLSVDPEQYGRGVGTIMLCKGCAKALRKFPGHTVVAMVRGDNLASKRVFLKAGFIVAEQIIDIHANFLRFELRNKYEYQ